MNQEILNKFEERGLNLPFSVTRDGTTITSQKGESLKSKLSQTGTVIFETISAVGGVKIENIEIIGESKGLLLLVDEEHIIGTLFDKTEAMDLKNLWNLINELKAEKEVVVPVEEKVKAPISPEILDEMKTILKDYLGDFTERIYQNQLKSQRIKADELYEEDLRRFIFALGKAAGMIIGPTKGKELTNKLLAKIK